MSRDGTPLSRVAALAPPLLLLLVLVAGTFVGVARYTTLLDPAVGAFVTMPTDAYHLGAKPCLRYPPVPNPTEVATVARTLAAAGLKSEDVGDRVGDFYARANAREAMQHPLSEADEYLDAAEQESRGLGRVALMLKRDRLRAKLKAMLVTPPRVSLTVASLPPEQRAAIEAQWAANPSLLVLPALLDLVRQMRIDVTERRLDVLLAALQHQVDSGQPPSLDTITVAADDRSDDWGQPITLEPGGENELKLISLGGDRLPGGTGYEADLTRTLTVKGGAAAPPPAPLTCLGKTEIELKRTDIDAAFADVSTIGKSMRIVPAVTGGVVSGFKLFDVRGDFVRSVGFCEGDVLHTVNGLPLTSPDKALEAYTKVKDATRIELGLTRGGKPITLRLQVR